MKERKQKKKRKREIKNKRERETEREQNKNKEDEKRKKKGQRQRQRESHIEKERPQNKRRPSIDSVQATNHMGSASAGDLRARWEGSNGQGLPICFTLDSGFSYWFF